MVLRDGRTLIGYLRSVDQFGTCSTTDFYLIRTVNSHYSKFTTTGHNRKNIRGKEIWGYTKRNIFSSGRERFAFG